MADAELGDPVLDGIRRMLMRGGTSNGADFLAEDLPGDPAVRDDLLLRIMGSPDPRQIDGIGGARPLASKVASVSASSDPAFDVVDEAVVSDAQTCGNLLASVGPFSVERGLVLATGDETSVRIRLTNTRDAATAVFSRRAVDRVAWARPRSTACPGTAAKVARELSGDRPLLPTGRVVDEIAGHNVTLVDKRDARRAAARRGVRRGRGRATGRARGARRSRSDTRRDHSPRACGSTMMSRAYGAARLRRFARPASSSTESSAPASTADAHVRERTLP